MKWKSIDKKDEPQETQDCWFPTRRESLRKQMAVVKKTVASEPRGIARVCTQCDLEGRTVLFKGRGLWPRACLGRASRRGI